MFVGFLPFRGPQLDMAYVKHWAAAIGLSESMADMMMK